MRQFQASQPSFAPQSQVKGESLATYATVSPSAGVYAAPASPNLSPSVSPNVRAYGTPSAALQGVYTAPNMPMVEPGMPMAEPGMLPEPGMMAEPGLTMPEPGMSMAELDMMNEPGMPMPEPDMMPQGSPDAYQSGYMLHGSYVAPMVATAAPHYAAHVNPQAFAHNSFTNQEESSFSAVDNAAMDNRSFALSSDLAASVDNELNDDLNDDLNGSMSSVPGLTDEQSIALSEVLFSNSDLLAESNKRKKLLKALCGDSDDASLDKASASAKHTINKKDAAKKASKDATNAKDEADAASAANAKDAVSAADSANAASAATGSFSLAALSSGDSGMAPGMTGAGANAAHAATTASNENSGAPIVEVAELDSASLIKPNPNKVVLDAESERLDKLSQSRKETFAKETLAIKAEENKSKIIFSLVEHGLSTMGQNTKLGILADEQDEDGKADVEDFITGNVTIVQQELRTGTDNNVVSAAFAETEEEPTTKTTINVAVPTSTAPWRPTISVTENRKKSENSLFPLLMREFGHHWYVYGLTILCCILCLMKVYQVQETRDLTARYNELAISNADLDKQWLNLMAVRQNLSEHAKIRAFASSNLKMKAPRTESEQVISLH